MSAVVREFRTRVMTLVEASWQDPSGALQSLPARMEDKSLGGACIRVKTPIGVGSKLSVQWRFEQFSGTAKYCRSEGREYLVGIQRDAAKSSVSSQPVPAEVPSQKSVRSSAPLVSTAKIESLPQRQESKASEIPMAAGKVESAQSIPIASSTTPPCGVDDEIDGQGGHRVSRLQSSISEDLDALRRTQLPNKQPPEEAGKERKPMGRKWLELAHWRIKPVGLSVTGEANGEAGGNGKSNDKGEKENFMPHVTPPTEKAPAHSAREVQNFQVELPPTEDIYREAGIMIPRKGYSIQKVVEMLNSEHIRSLSKEMKRAAVLMALDAAGIPLDQVQQDAKVRQAALDAFEAGQKKQVEVEWARKAEEIVQIQAELESIKAHYMARVSRNLEGVAREKVAFSSWQTMKQQEIQSMSEAAELCLKAPAAAPPSAAHTEISLAAAASTRPV
jgi:hypothetical protein